MRSPGARQGGNEGYLDHDLFFFQILRASLKSVIFVVVFQILRSSKSWSDFWYEFPREPLFFLGFNPRKSQDTPSTDRCMGTCLPQAYGAWDYRINVYVTLVEIKNVEFTWDVDQNDEPPA